MAGSIHYGRIFQKTRLMQSFPAHYRWQYLCCDRHRTLAFHSPNSLLFYYSYTLCESMPSKINWLLQNTSPGSLVLQSWLPRNSISPSLAFKYEQSGWLKKLRAGVYARAGREPGWSDALWYLQSQLEAPVHLAGLNSLSWQGRSHYIQLKQSQCWLTVEKNDITQMI